ncbi:MAG: hypothetical protein MHM6MM_001943 [Cercozoa sp. M6MM]
MSEFIEASTGETVEVLSGIHGRGPVVKGFQRGREIGVRTANLDPAANSNALSTARNGVYCGWASVDGGEAHMALVSIGYNPFFKNESKTVEAHLLHEFPEDFYGAELRLVLCGYLREQSDFTSLDALMDQIRRDIDVGREVLQREAMLSQQALLSTL